MVDSQACWTHNENLNDKDSPFLFKLVCELVFVHIVHCMESGDCMISDCIVVL